ASRPRDLRRVRVGEGRRVVRLALGGAGERAGPADARGLPGGGTQERAAVAAEGAGRGGRAGRVLVLHLGERVTADHGRVPRTTKTSLDAGAVRQGTPKYVGGPGRLVHGSTRRRCG